jgi:hypothetical protein
VSLDGSACKTLALRPEREVVSSTAPTHVQHASDDGTPTKCESSLVPKKRRDLPHMGHHGSSPKSASSISAPTSSLPAGASGAGIFSVFTVLASIGELWGQWCYRHLFAANPAETLLSGGGRVSLSGSAMVGSSTPPQARVRAVGTSTPFRLAGADVELSTPT